MHRLCVLLFLASALAADVTSTSTPEETWSCDSFDANVPVHAELLPSELPGLSCKCVGISRIQSCPRWTFLVGSGNASLTRNETKRESTISCTSYLQFQVNPDRLPLWNEFRFQARCLAGDFFRTASLVVRKSWNEYKCNQDWDCALSNQGCSVRGFCPDHNCPKICHCESPLPIFIPNSPDNCYSKSEFGGPCNYTSQCQSGRKYRVVCTTDANGAKQNGTNETHGVCQCPSGFAYNGKYQDCLLTVPVAPEQSLTERIMIAVCCGIVGVFIFVFVSYVVKRNFGSGAHRQSGRDYDHDPRVNESLTSEVGITEKPPSYQECQQADEQVCMPLDTVHEQPMIHRQDSFHDEAREVLPQDGGPDGQESRLPDRQLQSNV